MRFPAKWVNLAATALKEENRLKRAAGLRSACWILKSRFHYFRTLPELIRLAEMTYIRFPLSLRTAREPAE